MPDQNRPSHAEQHSTATENADDPRRAQWNSSLAAVERYVRRHGAPTSTCRDDDGFAPGQWMTRQRERWHHNLDEHQKQALLSLNGFVRPGYATHVEMATVGAELVPACLAALDARVRFARGGTWNGYPVGKWLAGVNRGAYTLTADQYATLHEAGLLDRFGFWAAQRAGANLDE